MATANPVPHDSSIAERTTADLVVFIAPMPAEQFAGLLKTLDESFSADTTIIATQNELPPDVPTRLRVSMLPKANPVWMLRPGDFIAAAECAQDHASKAVLILGPLADSLSALALRGLAEAVLNESVDLAVPNYALPPNAGLINSAILYPLTRAVFASRIRFPLSIDLGMSRRMAARMSIASLFLKSDARGIQAKASGRIKWTGYSGRPVFLLCQELYFAVFINHVPLFPNTRGHTRDYFAFF